MVCGLGRTREMNLVLIPLATENLSPISFDIATFVLMAINVLIVILVLYKLLFKPLHNVIEKRTKFVEDSLAEAKAQRSEAERLFAEYQEKLRNAQVEAREIVASATKEAEALARRRREEAEQETQRLLERAKAEIENERQRALQSLRDEVTTLTLMVAERVIGRELTYEDHQRLVKEMLAEVQARESEAGEVQ